MTCNLGKPHGYLLQHCRSTRLPLWRDELTEILRMSTDTQLRCHLACHGLHLHQVGGDCIARLSLSGSPSSTAMSKTMKAVKVVGINHAEVQEVAVPEPQDLEVLVKIQATALNPIDWYGVARSVLLT